MRRTELLQGLRMMKFETVLERCKTRELSQLETAEILGVNERTFWRWRDRYEDEGLDGLYDRRLGTASAKPVPVDEVEQVLTLYRERYQVLTAKHFHEKLVSHHAFRHNPNLNRDYCSLMNDVIVTAFGAGVASPRR